MPLSFADLNSVNTIKKIGGSKEQQRHLENLGFVPGYRRAMQESGRLPQSS